RRGRRQHGAADGRSVAARGREQAPSHPGGEARGCGCRTRQGACEMSAATRRIVLVSPDRAFAQEVRSALAASEGLELTTVEAGVTELRGELQEPELGAVVVDMDASRLDEIEALQ